MIAREFDFDTCELWTQYKPCFPIAVYNENFEAIIMWKRKGENTYKIEARERRRENCERVS